MPVMSKKSGSDKTTPPSLTGKDVDLWRLMTGDVERYDDQNYLEIAEEPAQKSKHQIKETISVLPNASDNQTTRQGQDLDKRTEARLRKGKMKIDSTLDLHGMGQSEAHRALIAFISRSYEQQKRCLLVITGKGKARDNTNEDHWLSPPRGVLKARTPDWLSDERLRNYVLKAVPAQPKDGGDGALYVLLRRKRS